MANSIKNGIWAGQKTKRDHDSVNGIINGYYCENMKDETGNMKAEELSSGRNFHISAFRFHISEAEIRRPYFALLGTELNL